MKKNQTDKIEQLVNYHENLLSGQERREVEIAVHSDPNLQRMLDNIKSMDDHLIEWGRKNRIANSVVDRLNQPSQPIENNHVQPSWDWPGILSGFQLRLAGCAVAVLLVSLCVYYFSTTQWGYGSAELLYVSGDDVIIQNRDGDSISNHSEINTYKDSFVRVQMGDRKSILEIGPNSIATIEGPRSVSIRKGKLWTKVANQYDEPYRITTLHGTITVLGTAFEVVVEANETIVNVEKGLVQIASNLANSGDQISKGQTGVIQKGVLIKKKMEAPKVAPWRNQYTGKQLTTEDIAKTLNP